MSTREKLCAAALPLFVRQGIEATTTRQIAAAAAVAEGTIYRHFASKDELAVELFVRNWLAFTQYMQRAASSCESPRARVEAMLGWLLTAADRAPDLFDYLFLVRHTFSSQMARDVLTPPNLIKSELADLLPPAELELHLAVLMGGLCASVAAVRAGKLASGSAALPVLMHLLPAPPVQDERRAEISSAVYV